MISFFSSPFLRVCFCWIFPPIFLQFSSSKRSLLPTVPPLQIKPPQWHHKNCIVATLSPYLLLSTVEGTFSHFPFNMIMKTDFWLTDHLMLVTYTREITTSYPIRGSTLHLLLPSGHFLDVLKINHHFKLWKKKITFKFNMKMCRTVRTNFGYPILVIKNRWKGCTKAKKIENSVYFNCYKYSLFFICIKKKKTMLQFTEDFKHCWTVQLSDL